MSSITIISATNRPNSNTEKTANHYQKVLKEKNIPVQLLSLTALPDTFLISDLYGKRSTEFEQTIKTYIEPATKVIFISPEYNGSFSGILKIFLDAIPPKTWANKKACLTGVANGRAGNLRGMEHLTNILNYLKLNVFYNKLPISRVETLLDSNGELTDQETQRLIEEQLHGFLEF